MAMPDTAPALLARPLISGQNLKFVKTLQEVSGADPRVIHISGRTLLHWLMNRNTITGIEIVNYLIAEGEDPTGIVAELCAERIHLVNPVG